MHMIIAIKWFLCGATYFAVECCCWAIMCPTAAAIAIMEKLEHWRDQLSHRFAELDKKL